MLDHLIENAIKYSPEGERVRVEVKARDDRQVMIKVRDNGPGIAPGEIEHLFTRFYRGKEESGKSHGAGLGLYIARKLVEAQGGEIWVESEVGTGTSFVFTLPQIEIGE